VGGAGELVDAMAVRGTGGGVGATWGAVEVMGTARGITWVVTEVGKATDDGVMRGGRSDHPSLYSRGGLTTRAHSLTASLCSRCGQTTREHGLTTSSGPQ
jgi:hypothetical protein